MSKKSAVDEQQVIEEKQVENAAGNDTHQLTMQVRVHSPFRNYYDGIAYSLTAENATGVFDVLPHHHSFISLLLPCELLVRTTTEGELKIRISGGVIHVKADQVIVFLDV